MFGSVFLLLKESMMYATCWNVMNEIPIGSATLEMNPTPANSAHLKYPRTKKSIATHTMTSNRSTLFFLLK